MLKPEKTQKISEFDFLAISANMKKTQENRCDCLNWTNLKIPLHFWKKSATFFEIYCTTRKSEKTRVILRGSKKWKAEFWAFLFSEFRTLQKSRIAGTYHWFTTVIFKHLRCRYAWRGAQKNTYRRIKAFE